MRRAGRSRDLPWEALRKPAAAAAAPSATGREGGREEGGRPLRHPATGLSAPADRAAGSSPYPSAQRAARIPPPGRADRALGPRRAACARAQRGAEEGAELSAAPAVVGGTGRGRGSGPLRRRPVVPGRQRAGSMAGGRAGRAGEKGKYRLYPGCAASARPRPPGERRAVRRAPEEKRGGRGV